MTKDTPNPEMASPESSDRKFSRSSRRRLRLLELSLLLSLWFFYGAVINSRNLEAFNLQYAGVEAMVERHQFSLEGSAEPRFQIKVYFDGDRPFGDTFFYNGRQFAAKQPGQFMAGAVVYFFLRMFGLSYLNNYLLTAALVTFFTTSLVTAVAAVAVFRTVRELMASETLAWPLASAFSYGLATTAFVYSGIAYHDALASGYLVIAFYLVVLLAHRQPRGRTAKVLAGAVGLLLGITITTSMLPFFMVCVVGAYLVSLRRWDLTLWTFIGGVVGLAPLLFFNAVSFGNPFLPSYLAGGYPESNLHWDLQNTVQKLRFYFWQITLYVPIVWLGILGLALYPRSRRRAIVAILALLLAIAIQILNIDSHGGCHYGPRFLLPVMPYAGIGLAGFSYLRGGTSRLLALAAIALAAATSFVINFVGALYGAMYCETDVYAFWRYLGPLRTAGWKDMPLAGWLVAPLLLSAGLLAYSIWTCRRFRIKSSYVQS
jgi:4-amino-4-deoxy-L-arabinose transferase-like glycosyltransferase